MMNQNYEMINDVNHDFSSNDTYVYELVDPTTQTPFYVGKGKHRRATNHVSMRQHKRLRDANPHKAHTIDSIISGGHKVIIRIVSTHLLEEDAFEAEVNLIHKYGRWCNQTGMLTNITRGGEGNTRDALAVDQYTMWGEYLRTWQSAAEATAANGWECFSAIHKCCTGRERSYKGYLWCPSGSAPRLLTKNKPVYQWTRDGVLVNVYANEHKAADAINCSATSINACTSGKTQTAGGFIWSHENVFTKRHKSSPVHAVRNITTGKTYTSVSQAAKDAGVSASQIYRACNRKAQTVKGCEYCYEGSVQ